MCVTLREPYDHKSSTSHAEDDDFHCLGWRRERRRLGFDSLAFCIRPVFTVFDTHRSMAKDYAVAFSALLDAAAASQRKIKTLNACNGETYGLPTSDITLKQTHKSLLSSLAKLEFLRLCLCNWEAQPDDSTLGSLIDIPITAAPNLTVLEFSQWHRNGPLSPQYFVDLSQLINFIQLEQLSLLD